MPRRGRHGRGCPCMSAWMCERKCMVLVRRYCNVCNICIIPEDFGQDGREGERAGRERGWRFTQSNTNNTPPLYSRTYLGPTLAACMHMRAHARTHINPATWFLRSCPAEHETRAPQRECITWRRMSHHISSTSRQA